MIIDARTYMEYTYGKPMTTYGALCKALEGVEIGGSILVEKILTGNGEERGREALYMALHRLNKTSDKRFHVNTKYMNDAIARVYRIE